MWQGNCVLAGVNNVKLVFKLLLLKSDIGNNSVGYFYMQLLLCYLAVVLLAFLLL